MLRLLGILLLIGSCTVMGLIKGASLRRRARTLRAAVDALEMLRSEICTRLTPMPELCSRLAAEGPEETRQLFAFALDGLERLGERSFALIWAEAAEKWASGSLQREEKEAIAALGLSLGRFDASEQELAINRGIERLEGRLASAEAEAKTGGRLYGGLGLASGLMLSVMLI